MTLALCGCSYLGYLNPNFLLPSHAHRLVSEAAYRYNNALRFGNLEMAVSCVEPEQRASFLDFFGVASRESIRFTDVEIHSITLGPEPDEARVISSIRLYQLPSIEEITVREEQRWRYDPADRAWYVAPDLDRFASAGAPRVVR